MKVGELLEKLEKDSDFKAWKEKNSESYLVHIFFTDMIPEIGYYNKDDTITTFTFEEDKLKISDEQKIFKKDDHKVMALELENVGIEYVDAKARAENIQNETYKGHDPIKTITVLQHTEKGQMYNFTFITQTFQTLNVKIDSKTGDVIEHKLYSLMDIGKVEKGGK